MFVSQRSCRIKLYFLMYLMPKIMSLAHNRHSLNLLTISPSIPSLWPLTRSFFSHCYPGTCFIFTHILKVINVDIFYFFMPDSKDIVSQVEGRKEGRKGREG